MKGNHESETEELGPVEAVRLVRDRLVREANGDIYELQKASNAAIDELIETYGLRRMDEKSSAAPSKRTA